MSVRQPRTRGSGSKAKWELKRGESKFAPLPFFEGADAVGTLPGGVLFSQLGDHCWE